MGATDWPVGDLVAGEVLARRYRITEFLGQGGMGLVYEALDLTNATPVAVKLPRREIRNRKKALARFEQESRAASKLKGPNVVRVTDIAELDDGTPFIVMELLVGTDLATLLDRRGALPVGEAVGHVREAAAGVAEAHAAGIVHRDLKPHNLFLVEEAGRQRVKVLDFGISKIAGADAPRMTTTNARLGTPLYVSPEQLVSAKYVDARSDVWSLGVILYELLTGTRPFEGKTAIEVAAAIQSLECAPPSARSGGIPEGLDRVVMKALSKDKGLRFASVTEFARALEPFVGRPAGARAESQAAPPARRVAPIAAGATHVDSPREDSIAPGQSPPEERTRTPGHESARTEAEESSGSRLWLVLAALFGVALLALMLLSR